jgi:hypothetical protein
MELPTRGVWCFSTVWIKLKVSTQEIVNEYSGVCEAGA